MQHFEGDQLKRAAERLLLMRLHGYGAHVHGTQPSPPPASKAFSPPGSLQPSVFLGRVRAWPTKLYLYRLSTGRSSSGHRRMVSGGLNKGCGEWCSHVSRKAHLTTITGTPDASNEKVGICSLVSKSKM